MLTLITPPAVEPLSIEDAKLWARIDGAQFDALLPMMIASAREMAEHELGAKLITQTWRADLYDWPDAAERYALFPVQSVALSYWDGSTWSDLPLSDAVAVRDKYGVLVQRTLTGVYPALVSTTGPRVRADFTVGYGDNPEDVPNAIRQFMAAHIALAVQEPQAARDGKLTPNSYVSRLLDPFRTYL